MPSVEIGIVGAIVSAPLFLSAETFIASECYLIRTFMRCTYDTIFPPLWMHEANIQKQPENLRWGGLPMVEREREANLVFLSMEAVPNKSWRAAN